MSKNSEFHSNSCTFANSFFTLKNRSSFEDKTVRKASFLAQRSKQPRQKKTRKTTRPLLNDATHAAHSRTQSHDYIAKFLADLATQYGILTSVKTVPIANSSSQRRAGLVTYRGGLVHPNSRLNFDQGTLLVMDFELGHTFDSLHSFKLFNLATMESQKRAKYHSDYHDQGWVSPPWFATRLGSLVLIFKTFCGPLPATHPKISFPPAYWTNSV
jgi:hypothetical protein